MGSFALTSLDQCYQIARRHGITVELQLSSLIISAVSICHHLPQQGCSSRSAFHWPGPVHHPAASISTRFSSCYWYFLYWADTISWIACALQMPGSYCWRFQHMCREGWKCWHYSPVWSHWQFWLYATFTSGTCTSRCYIQSTRNMFCGKWYMPHSHVHIAGCMAHALNGYISTFGLKSDVNIVFLDPDFV